MSLKKREASLIRNINNTNTDRGLKAVVNIVGRIPLLSLTQQAGFGPNHDDSDSIYFATFNHTISETIIDGSEITERYNILYDENEVDRFTPIARCSTESTLRDGILYYDTVFGDLILIPDLSSLGLEELKNRTFDVEGYIVGGNCGQEIFNARSVSVEDSEQMVSPTPMDTKTQLDVKLLFMNISLGNQERKTRVGVLGTNNSYYEQDYIHTASVMALGSTQTVFNNPTYVYKPVRVSGSSYKFISLGYVDVNMLTFQMPWE